MRRLLALRLGGGSSSSSGGSASISTGSSTGGGGGGLKTWLRRLGRWPQLDFELAVWQMGYLCIAPRRTKNTWARDDPAMLLLITLCLVTSAVLWSVMYAHYGFSRTLATVCSFVLVHFFGIGLLVSTTLWALSNRFLRHATHVHATDQKVEWPYAFDIHANSFFPFFLQLYVAQLLLAPVVTRSNWVCLWVGNTLYLSAFTQYAYVTYLGYNALPFLIRSELLLFPVAIFAAFYIVSLLGFNISHVVLEGLFGR
ncbi:UNC-50 protein [Rhodotorula sp. JG-1b]|nr:UNC-50 protein [Rhodotorula sp. JG-1b]